MNVYLLTFCVSFVGSVLCRERYQTENNYQVVGVDCGENESVSCMIIECPDDQFCPAANFCYNPKCVCRKGFRRLNGVCVPKHSSLHLNKGNLETALLEMPYREL
ncbi:uncharacterized protein LOC122617817 [Drosophila teissieri]|uniref:uncharacterized protein LOC122617817 n=1 Tax=Drosophila teissieri TaxID=7243 RepID=UPI001CBA4404|nr:uncharacterized protein LOC122617817 [Drosophila teissieri]